jgi:hypothetical protein
MVGFLTPLIGLASTWFEGQTKKSAAKADAEVALKNAEAEVYKRRATGELDWDLAAMSNTDRSWKDEYLTIVLSIPLIMCFVPGAEELVKNGFARLNEVPDWYKASFAVVVSASFGVRNLMKLWKR